MGRKTKQTPAGWISGNAPCCSHRGEKIDKRGRGGILVTNDGFNYSCFNCGFKAGYSTGKLLSKNTRSLMSWLDIADTEIQQLALDAVKNKNDRPKPVIELRFDLESKELPEDCKTINELILEGCIEDDFLNVVAYILDRGMELGWYNWMWSSKNGYQDRVIVPFYDKEKIVGWTGRKITEGKPKYLTSAQPGYVFNLDRQTEDRQYVIVVEGQFDAIAVDGVAIMHNDPNETQIARIKNLGKEVIIVPDNDQPGTKLISAAINNNWSVSLPEWGNDVKDVADAVKKYGRLYTLLTIIKYREHGQIKLTMIKKRITNGPAE